MNPNLSEEMKEARTIYIQLRDKLIKHIKSEESPGYSELEVRLCLYVLSARIHVLKIKELIISDVSVVDAVNDRVEMEDPELIDIKEKIVILDVIRMRVAKEKTALEKCTSKDLTAIYSLVKAKLDLIDPWTDPFYPHNVGYKNPLVLEVDESKLSFKFRMV